MVVLTMGILTFDAAALHFSPQGTSLRFICAATSVSPAASVGVTPLGQALARAGHPAAPGLKRCRPAGGRGVRGGIPVWVPPDQGPQPPRGRLQPGTPPSRPGPTQPPQQDPAPGPNCSSDKPGCFERPSHPWDPSANGKLREEAARSRRGGPRRMTKFGPATCHCLPFMAAS